MGRGKGLALDLDLDLYLDLDLDLDLYRAIPTSWTMLAETEMTGGIATVKRTRAITRVTSAVKMSTTSSRMAEESAAERGGGYVRTA